MTADYYDFFHEFKRGGAAHIKEVRGINVDVNTDNPKGTRKPSSIPCFKL